MTSAVSDSGQIRDPSVYGAFHGLRLLTCLALLQISYGTPPANLIPQAHAETNEGCPSS